MKNPLISVIIPTYNQAAYLSQTLDSVLGQTYTPLEIIVIDDGSTDETKHIEQLYTSLHPSIRWYSQINQGPSFSRNRAIHLAQGHYIALLDADDLMDPNRLILQYQAFQMHPAIDIVYTALKLIDSQGKETGEIHSQTYLPQDFNAFMLFRNLIPAHSTLLLKSECLKNYSYDENYTHAEDYELMLRLTQHYTFFYLDLLLTSYRRHHSNLSNNLTAHHQAELNILQRYSPEQIEKIIAQTSLAPQDKSLLKGKIFYNQERFDQALEVFQHLSLPLAFFYAGNCYLKHSLWTKAVKSYEQALKDEKTNAACWNNLGVTYQQLNQLKEAQECFRQALILRPTYLDAAHNQTFPKEMRVTWRELRSHLIPYQL
jgi:glycosyltransferase involved in cell wall biosynthesis